MQFINRHPTSLMGFFLYVWYAIYTWIFSVVFFSSLFLPFFFLSFQTFYKATEKLQMNIVNIL